MSEILERICTLADRQHDAVAIWQLLRPGVTRSAVVHALRDFKRVYSGVYTRGDLTEDGWLMAATLTYGPGAAIAHATGLMLLGMRPWRPGPIEVIVPGRTGRAPREGILIHAPRGQVETMRVREIPVVTPTRALLDARLPRYELYRAVEEAQRQWLPLDLPRLRASLNEVFAVHDNVRGRTRSDAEAEFLFLCHDSGIELPRVNHRLNRCETDFHWPRARLVLEVDGHEFHKERRNFEEDRLRGLRHRAAGYEVIRASASQVFDTPQAVVAAIRSAAPYLFD